MFYAVIRGTIGLFEEKVVELGWDGDFILVKCRQCCNIRDEDYFIIDIAKDMEGSVNQRMGVLGPFSHDEYLGKRTELGVPEGLELTLKP